MKKQSAPLDLDDLFGTSSTATSNATGQATQTGAAAGGTGGGGGGTQDILDLFGSGVPTATPTVAASSDMQGSGQVAFDLFDAFNVAGAPPATNGGSAASAGAPTGAVDLFSGLSMAQTTGAAAVPAVTPATMTVQQLVS